jgi:hypothetical protein
MKQSIRMLLLISLAAMGISSAAAQGDPCTREAVVASFAAAVSAGNVETWVQSYTSGECPQLIKDGALALANAYEQMALQPADRTTVKYEGDLPVVELTLYDVTTTFAVLQTIIPTDSWTYPRHLGSVYSDGAYRNIALAIAPNVFIVSPLSSFREAHRDQGEHVVTFADGQVMRGNLRTELDAKGDKSYFLDFADQLTLISLPVSFASPAPVNETPDTIWTLHITQPVDVTFTGADPFFANQFYSTEGYLSGGVYIDAASDTFEITTDGQKTLGNIADFEEISFLGAGENGQSVTLTYPEGKLVSGEITGLVSNSSGEVYSPRYSYLAMDLTGCDRRVVIGPEVIASLTKDAN